MTRAVSVVVDVAVAVVVVVVSLLACARSPYLLPAPRSSSPIGLEPERRGDTSSARAGLEHARQRCVARFSPAAHRLDALRDVLVALSGRCDGSSVSTDGLSWHLRCRADGFFASRTFAPLPEARARWSAAGAALARAATREAGVAELRVAFVGHADLESLDPTTPFVPCASTACALGLREPCAWPALALREASERTRGNEQLAFCRGASAALFVTQGFVSARGGSTGDLAVELASQVPLRVVVAGAGPQWQARHGGDCPTGSGTSQRCDSARRVDVFLQFVVDPADDPRTCPVRATSSVDVDALACLQDCYETLDPRPPFRLGTSGRSLFEPAGETATPGWIVTTVSEETRSRDTLAPWVRELATGDTRTSDSDDDGAHE